MKSSEGRPYTRGILYRNRYWYSCNYYKTPIFKSITTVLFFLTRNIYNTAEVTTIDEIQIGEKENVCASLSFAKLVSRYQ